MTETLAPSFSVSGLPRSLTDWATETLREAILSGHFEPGKRLDQNAIASELEISRTPLRGAIATLESEGLLQSRPYHGVFVIRVSKKGIRELFAVRALLEAEVARQSASLMPEGVLDGLEVVLAEVQKAYEHGDEAAQFEADRCFHQTLRKFSGNSLLSEILDGVNNRIQSVRRFAQMRPGCHVDEFAREHTSILRAMKEGNPELAGALMKEHLENSSIRVEELLD